MHAPTGRLKCKPQGFTKGPEIADRLEDFVSCVCQHIYLKDLKDLRVQSLAFAMGGCALSFQATCGLVGYLDGIQKSCGQD